MRSTKIEGVTIASGSSCSRGDNLFHFHNREFRGSRHDGIKISCGFAIDQVTHVVCALRANESIVRAQRLLQNVTLSADFALFFAASNFSAHADRREKRGNSRAVSAHAFAQNSLRHQFELDFSGVKLLLKVFRARSGKSRNNFANLFVLKKYAEFPFAGAAIIADDAQISRALPR